MCMQTISYILQITLVVLLWGYNDEMLLSTWDAEADTILHGFILCNEITDSPTIIGISLHSFLNKVVYTKKIIYKQCLTH